MNFANYSQLCESMGATQKSGHDIREDWDMLEDAVMTLLGAFTEDSHDRVHALTRGEQRHALESTAAARDAINVLCMKYHVPLVCAPSESSAQTASDIAKEAARLLLES